MKTEKLKIKTQEINKTFQKLPAFAHKKITADIFEIKNFKKTTASKFCVVGTGVPLHEDLATQGYETFDESLNKKEGHIDKHGCSTQISGLISLNTSDMKGLCPKSQVYHAKAFNDKGGGSYSALASSILWGVIKNVNCIILPCELKSESDGIYSILEQAGRANISVVAPISKANKIRYKGVLYVSKDQTHVKNSVNIPRRNKIYTTHLDTTYVKAHGLYYKLSVTAGLLENIKADGIRSNKNAYETMLSYFE